MIHAQYMVDLVTGCCYAVLCDSGQFRRAVHLTGREDVRDSALHYDFEGEGRDASSWKKGDMRNVGPQWMRRYLQSHDEQAGTPSIPLPSPIPMVKR